MLAFRLAFKNLIGAGLRTWLNVLVLSFSFFIIIFYNGMIDGWNQAAKKDTAEWQTGQGQLWHQDYDPFDSYTLEDAHATIDDSIADAIKQQKAVPILVQQASLYPQGRLQSILLKGIETNQNILKMPTAALKNKKQGLSAIIGERMADNLKIKEGERVLMRWRDKNGTFDAQEIYIAKIFACDVPAIDNGQIWIALDELQRIVDMPNEATYITLGKEYSAPTLASWTYKSPAVLLADLEAIIQSKKGSGIVLYGLLLIIALLAIFDTQVLSIFRRQKEIGTYIALGMTRSQVVRLFTIEGGANSLLAAFAAAIYGIPIFIYMSKLGIAIPSTSSDMGIAIAERIFPVYGLSLVLGTLVFVIAAATIVSYIPARKIAQMKPTDALKGKLQ